ncbi:Gfo/Idh/MocA family oxidoreductase [Nocardiopsis sp. EMB25]|uniref:Gfo/Idh/MocA family protein n=1 Tax=Nocardiopsis sp. EMB25 TaxID=2835867 RepID=UPI0022842279|nr:Gfo/Idh/MocA family oxidoreductase [Nocardiopsis sp. EMB25]MCY9783788.1 Gfo/Idh/MocA family oxidoreductase [Nocardiopsis sp. EMB25]
MNAPVPILLAGVHGHGRHHLKALLPLSESGLVRLVGVCDPTPPAADDALEGHSAVPHFADLGEAIDATGASVTILATPIPTHLPLVRTALDHGSHVLLEKPTTATLAEFDQLVAAVDASDLACQIGFQSLGSHALDTVRQLIDDGSVGELRGIGGAGTWIRTSTYYDRAPWAGRRRLHDRDVVDGALTNPFAHAVATALSVAGASANPPAQIELELFHAHPIESDDTSCLRIRTPDGTPITVAVTLCAQESLPPRLTVHGTLGRIDLDYTLDRVTLHRPGRAPVTTTHPRTGLLENLLAHVDGDAPLLVPPRATHAFMHVLEAVRTAPDPVTVPDARQRVSRTPEGTRRVITGIDALVHRSAQSLALFSELDPAWSPDVRAPEPTVEARP